MTLDTIKQQTTWNDAAASINSNFAKLLQAINAGVGNEGFNEEELRNFLESSGYTTEEWVLARGYITASSLVPYAKKEDLSSYATIAALSTLEGKHNVLRGEFDALYSLLNDDTTGVINTWNEVVDFINEYSGSENLETILVRMQNDISSRLLASDFESWKTNTFTPHANLVANHTTRLDGLDQSILSINTRIDGVDKTIEDHIAEFIAFRANFEITDNLILVRKNFASTEEVSAKGINQGTGGGGGSSYSRLDTWEGYDNNKAGYVLSAGLGYGLKVAIDELNGYDLDNRVRSIENNYVSKDAGGVVNGGLVVSSLAVAGGSSSQFLKADGSLDGTSYLSTRGGVISGDLTINGYLINDGHFLFARNTDGAEWIVTDRNWQHNYDIIHSGNVGDYAPAITANQWATSAAFIGEVGTAYIAYRGGSDWSVTNNGWNNEYTLYHSGNFNPANYLPLSGGTINGDLTLSSSSLHINNGNILFNETYYLNNSGDSLRWYAGGWNTILHTGNIVESVDDLNDTTMWRFFRATYKSANLPMDTSNYLSGISFAVDGAVGYRHQLGGDYNGRLFYRHMEAEVWQDWKTIAFTDSNVASAQALKHSNGTVGATVDAYGGICLSTRGIWSADGGLSLFDYNAGVLNVGYSMRNSYITDIYGNTIRFKVGDTPRMLINSSGNVLIGTTVDSGEKLQVESSANTVLAIRGTTYPEASIAYIGSDGKLWTAGKGIMSHGDSFGFYSATAGRDIVRFTTEGAIINGTLNAGATSLSSLYVSSDIVTNRIIIGGVTLSTEDGVLKIESDMYATGEISAHGLNKGESGGGGSSYSRLDTWTGYDSSKAGYVLSAGLGYDLKLAVDELNGYNLNSRLTTVESSYLSKNGGTISGKLTLKPQNYHAIDIVSPDNALAQITISTNDTLRGILQYNGNFGFGFSYSDVGGLYLDHDGVLKYVDSSLAKHPLLHEGNCDMYALSVWGGTLKGNLTLSESFLKITAYGKEYGYNVNAENGEPIYLKDNAWNTLIHSGNVGEYAITPSTIGSQSVAYAANAGSVDWGNVSGKPSVAIQQGANNFIYSLNEFTFVPNEYNDVVWFNYRTTGGKTGNIVSYIFGNGKGEELATISNGQFSGNAATATIAESATKLATPRTIWGQSFDGTGNVDGALYMTNNSPLSPEFSNAGVLGMENNTLYLGYSNVGFMTTINGRSLSMQTFDGVTRLLINSSGNVGIGTTNPQYKLHVEGTGYFSGALTANGGMTVNGSLSVGGASIHPTANNPYFQLYQNNNYWYWQADDNYAYIGGTMSKALRIDQSGNVLVIGATTLANVLSVNRDGSTGSILDSSKMAWKVESYSDMVRFDAYTGSGTTRSGMLMFTYDGDVETMANLTVGNKLTVNNGLSVSKGLSASDGIVSDWITAGTITANTSASIAALTVSGLSTLTGGIATNDIHGNGQSLYIGNPSNNAYIKVREDMVGSSSMWSIPRDGKATFTSLTTPTLSVTGSATIASVTIDAGNATLSNLTVNTAATLKQLVVGIDGMSCNGPATFNDFIYGSSITPRTDNYYVLGNNNYKWYAVTAYNVNVHDAITIEAGKELRFKDNNGVVHTLKYDSTKQAFVFDGNVNATGEISAKKLNA